MAARKHLSPTSTLLRGSRLFSLPPPLPRPDMAAETGGGQLISSNTATLPYPTHQAIATTPSSLGRGDWGLKRPLPLKSTTNSTTPAVRFTAIDTIEHITDFESAADHTLNLKKWQEMHFPIMATSPQQSNPSSYKTPKSSFERYADITDPKDPILSKDPVKEYAKMIEKLAKETAESLTDDIEKVEIRMPHIPQGVGEPARWRAKGPYLPSIQSSEFESYLREKVSRPDTKARFKAYIRNYIQMQISRRRRKEALDSGETIPTDPKDVLKFESLSSTGIQSVINIFRQKCLRDPLNCELTQNIIIPFLDLPPIPITSTDYSTYRHKSKYMIKPGSEPKSTHPSAGLSYLQSSAYLTNHPLLGPQRNPPPIPARVLEPRQTAYQTNANAKLGVAGVVAFDNAVGSKATIQNATFAEQGVQTLDLETKGGKKIWVHPKQASIGPDGRIKLEVVRADGEARRVREGELVDRAPVRVNARRDAASTESLVGGLGELGKEGVESGSGSGRVKGFDVGNEGLDTVEFLKAFASRT